MSRNSPKAMILAAGLGTRLRPLTQNTPKSLLLVGNKPLIVYSLELLKKHGITEVLINLHYLGELIENELGDGRKFGMKITYSWEPQVLGTGGGIKKGESFFEGKPFFVLNSDILIDVDLKALMKLHRAKTGIATMVVAPRDVDSPHTEIRMTEAGKIITIGDSKSPSKSPKKFRSVHFTGVQVLEPVLLRYLPENQESCIIRQGYQPALVAGEKIFGFLYQGYWNDLGTLDRYRQAERNLQPDGINLQEDREQQQSSKLRKAP